MKWSPDRKSGFKKWSPDRKSGFVKLSPDRKRGEEEGVGDDGGHEPAVQRHAHLLALAAQVEWPRAVREKRSWVRIPERVQVIM
jgi:hypothetical protein